MQIGWHLFCSFGFQWPFPKGLLLLRFSIRSVMDFLGHLLQITVSCVWMTSFLLQVIGSGFTFLSRIIEQLSFQHPTSKLVSNKYAIHLWATHCEMDSSHPVLPSLSSSLFVPLSSLQCLCLIKGPERQPHQCFQSFLLHLKDKDYFLQHNNKIFHSLIVTALWALSANHIFWYFNLSLLQTLCSLGCFTFHLLLLCRRLVRAFLPWVNTTQKCKGPFYQVRGVAHAFLCPRQTSKFLSFRKKTWSARELM